MRRTRPRVGRMVRLKVGDGVSWCGSLTAVLDRTILRCSQMRSGILKERRFIVNHTQGCLNICFTHRWIDLMREHEREMTLDRLGLVDSRVNLDCELKVALNTEAKITHR